MTFYRYLNALSLDVVAGALVGALFFAKIFKTELPATMLVALGLAIWSVYTMDHLIDSFQSPSPSSSLRHRIHKQYAGAFLVLLGLAVLTGSILFFSLPKATQIMGATLAAIILCYFVGMLIWRGKPLYHKEFMVALIYAGGIVLGPYSIRTDAFGHELQIIFTQYALLAYANLLLFAYFEYESDKLQKFNSLARTIGKAYTRLMIIACLMVVFTSSLTSSFLWSNDTILRNSQLTIALMSLPLGFLLVWPQYFQREERYRLIGDAIFFIPILLLWVL